MNILNKIPFANIDPCLRKYSKTVNKSGQTQSQINENEQIFCCITINQEKVYLYSDLFLFSKEIIYPVNLYLYKLFMFIFKFRKKNYNVSKLNDILYLPFPNFYDQKKTDLFVALIILTDSLVNLDQLSLERFFSIFVYLEKNSSLFISNKLQYRMLIFFLFVSIQRPMNLIETCIKNFQDINNQETCLQSDQKISLFNHYRKVSDYNEIDSEILFQFYFFKKIIINATVNDFFKTTNDNITIGNIEFNQSIEQVFNSVYFIDNNPSSLVDYESNLRLYFKNKFANNLLFLVGDFEKKNLFLEQGVFKSGIVIVTADHNKIEFLQLCLNDFSINSDFGLNIDKISEQDQGLHMIETESDYKETFSQICIINSFEQNYLNSFSIQGQYNQISNQDYVNPKQSGLLDIENLYRMFELFFKMLQSNLNKKFDLFEFNKLIMSSNLINQDVLMVLEILSISTFLFQKECLEKKIYISSNFSQPQIVNKECQIFDRNLISFYLLWYLLVYSNQDVMINSWQLKNLNVKDMFYLINLSNLKSRFVNLFSNFENKLICLKNTCEKKALVNFDTFNNIYVANNLFFIKSEHDKNELDLNEFENSELEILEFDLNFPDEIL